MPFPYDFPINLEFYTPWNGRLPEGTYEITVPANYYGYTFDKWEDNSTNRVRQIVLDADKTLTAYYIIVGGQVHEISLNAVSQPLSTPAYEATYNISRDAAAASQSMHVQETTFYLLKDALCRALGQASTETIFNISISSTVNTLTETLIEVVAGVIEIFKEAVTHTQTQLKTEDTLNISRDALAQTLTQTLFELGITKDVAVKALTTNTLVVTFNLPLNLVVKAWALSNLESTFNIRPETTVRVQAEVSVLKPTEVRITKLFLVIGDLAIQIQGS